MNKAVQIQGVSVIPINREGKILLQQRDNRPDLAYPGCWTTFGGHVEAGETPDEAMHREMLEEIELDLPVKLWKTIAFTVEQDGQVLDGEGFIYIAPIEQAEDEISLNEGQALGYFGVDDLAHLKIGWDFEPLFREVFAELAKGNLPIELRHELDEPERIRKIPCVSAILINRQRQVLLQQRDDKPGLPYAGWWALFGGSIEVQESPEDALRRELLEELELENVPLQFWKVYERYHPEKRVIVVQYIYIGQLDRDVTSLTLHEGQAVGYFDAHELSGLQIAFGFDDLLREFYAMPAVKSKRLTTVSAFLRNPQGQVIAQLRDDKPGLMFPGRWSTLGGRVEEGESPDEAVKRELMEEIEFTAPMTFWRLFQQRFSSGGRDYDVNIYAYVGDIQSAIADIPLHEGQRLAYLNASDIDHMAFAFGLDHLFREFFKTYDHRTGSDL